MKKVPVFNVEGSIKEIIQEEAEKNGGFFRPVFVRDKDIFLDYIKFEMPELSIINFGSEASHSILEEIKNDTWFHYGGVLGLYTSDYEKELIEWMRGSNIISIITYSELEKDLPRALRIIKKNRRFLFQRNLHTSFMKTITGTFTMENDPLDVRTYTNLVTNYLYNCNYINNDNRERLHVAIHELLMNAIEHGNCVISYDEKTAWLEERGNIIDLIREKNKLQTVRKKRVYFSYKITPRKSSFTIQDEGNGFNWKMYVDPSSPAKRLKLHGHGIKMAGFYASNVRYNSRGNQVSFDFQHNENEKVKIPLAFEKQKEITFKNNQIVFREGEESNHLYYIVSGRFRVMGGKKHLSTLTADDIFLGEMSFLRDDKRSATVISSGKSVLIKISRDEFLSVVKENPHYGIFLARLLADRLTRLREKVV